MADLEALEKTLNEADIAIKKQLNRFMGEPPEKFKPLHSKLKAAEERINTIIGVLPKNEPTLEQKKKFYESLLEVVDKGNDPLAKRAAVDILKSVRDQMPYPGDEKEQKEFNRRIDNEDKALTQQRIPSTIKPPEAPVKPEVKAKQAIDKAVADLKAMNNPINAQAVDNTIKNKTPYEGGVRGYLQFTEKNPNPFVPFDRGRPPAFKDAYDAAVKAGEALQKNGPGDKEKVKAFHEALNTFAKLNEEYEARIDKDVRLLETKSAKTLETVKNPDPKSTEEPTGSKPPAGAENFIKQLKKYGERVDKGIEAIQQSFDKVPELKSPEKKSAMNLKENGLLTAQAVFATSQTMPSGPALPGISNQNQRS